jgi:hypothetical protein
MADHRANKTHCLSDYLLSGTALHGNLASWKLSANNMCCPKAGTWPFLCGNFVVLSFMAIE